MGGLRGSNGGTMRARPILGTLAPAFLCLVFLTLACFAPVLFRGRQFAYRDSASYYYPLYLRVQQEWEAGRLPLWMPEENSGKPLLGDPTAAVLYPGKLIFAALPYPWAARVYVMAHVVLAFGAMRAPAALVDLADGRDDRGVGVRLRGAGALSILQCRLPGRRGLDAAGISLRRPLGPAGSTPGPRRAGDRPGDPDTRRRPGGGLPRRDRRGGLRNRVGDFPEQSAEVDSRPCVGRHRDRCVCWPAPVDLARSRDGGPCGHPRGLARSWPSGRSADSIRRRQATGLEGRFLGLGAACLLALLLCGAQLVPVLEFMAQSNRAGNLGANGRYVFSLSPTRLIGAFWPNVTGTVATAQDWPLALPAGFDETMQWVPSLYLGGLTLVLAAAGAGFRAGPPWRPWLTAIVVVGSLAAMGEYTSPIYWRGGPPPWPHAWVRRMIATWGIETTGRFRMATAVFTGPSPRCSPPSVRSDIRPSSSCLPAWGSRRWPDWAGTVCRSRIDDDSPW